MHFFFFLFFFCFVLRVRQDLPFVKIVTGQGFGLEVPTSETRAGWVEIQLRSRVT